MPKCAFNTTRMQSTLCLARILSLYLIEGDGIDLAVGREEAVVAVPFVVENVGGPDIGGKGLDLVAAVVAEAQNITMALAIADDGIRFGIEIASPERMDERHFLGIFIACLISAVLQRIDADGITMEWGECDHLIVAIAIEIDECDIAGGLGEELSNLPAAMAGRWWNHLEYAVVSTYHTVITSVGGALPIAMVVE